MRRIRPYLPYLVVSILAVTGSRARTVESPRFYGSLVSAFKTGFDYERTTAMAGSLEMPAGEYSSTVAGFRVLSYDPRDPDSDFGEFRKFELGGNLAFRRFPWEWAPGFFAQAQAGYGRRWERLQGYPPLPPGGWRWGGPLVIRRETSRLEAALGLGYLWKAGPLLIDARFALGPEWITLREWDEADRMERTRWLGSLLRFQDLEIGFSL